MNKRTKLKKGILKKKCNENCINYKIITSRKLVTSNICIGCKHKSIIEQICDQHYENIYCKNQCVTASDLLNEHKKYCENKYVGKCDIRCTECFAIFAIDNFNIERK